MSNVSEVTASPTRLLGAPILPSVCRLAWPGLIHVLFQTSASIADTYFVGKLGTVPLGGLALVFPFLMMMQMMSAGAIGGGVSSAIARATGAGDVSRAEMLLRHAVILGAALGIVFGGVMVLFGGTGYRLIGGEGEPLEYARTYSLVLFCGAPAVWLANFCANALRGQGNTLLPALVMSAASIVHIVLTSVLTPQMGIVGAAWSYILGYAAGALSLLILLVSGAGKLRLRFAGTRWSIKHVTDILGVGLLSSIQVIQTVLTAMLLTSIVAKFGVDALAGYGVGVRLELLLVSITFAVGAALVPLTGTHVGAGQYARAKHIAWVGSGIAALVAGAIGLTVAINPSVWMDMYTQDPMVLVIGSSYFRIVGPFYACVGVAIALYFASQGPKRVGWPVLAGTVRLVIAVGGSWLATSLGYSLESVFVCIALALLLWSCLTALAVKLVSWKQITQK